MVVEIQDRKKATRPEYNEFASLQDAWDRLHPFYVFDSILPSKDKTDEFQKQMSAHTLLLIDRANDLESRFYEDVVGKVCASDGIPEDKYYLSRLVNEGIESEIRGINEEIKSKTPPAAAPPSSSSQSAPYQPSPCN